MAAYRKSRAFFSSTYLLCSSVYFFCSGQSTRKQEESRGRSERVEKGVGQAAERGTRRGSGGRRRPAQRPIRALARAGEIPRDAPGAQTSPPGASPPRASGRARPRQPTAGQVARQKRRQRWEAGQAAMRPASVAWCGGAGPGTGPRSGNGAANTAGAPPAGPIPRASRPPPGQANIPTRGIHHFRGSGRKPTKRKRQGRAVEPQGFAQARRFGRRARSAGRRWRRPAGFGGRGRRGIGLFARV